MRIYVVAAPFYDLKDPVKFDHTKDGDIPKEYHLYNVGDIYPRIGGPLPDAGRVQELASDLNAQGRPLIRAIEVPEEPAASEPQGTAEGQGEPAAADETGYPEPAEAAAEFPEEPKTEPVKTERPAPKAAKPKKRSAK